MKWWQVEMRDLRPLIALLGLAVVLVAIVIGVARARGWRFGWWERFFAGGRRRRAGASPGNARSAPRSEAVSTSSGGGRREPGTIQIPLGLDDVPLIDAKTGARATALDTLEAEFELGDIGAVEAEMEPAQGAPRAGERKRGPERPVGESRPASRPRASEKAPEPPALPASPDLPDPEPSFAAGPTDSELLVVLTIMTPGERTFSGADIHRTLSAYGLDLDETGLYNHYGNRRGGNRQPVFSVANVLEPGVFELARMEELHTPGLCLFMRRPGPLSASVAFDLMLDVGNRIARTLQGVLCDDRRCRLTVQGVQTMQERIAHFALRHESGSRAPRTRGRNA